MKKKRKATPKQLKALAKGRRIRAANLRKKRKRIPKKRKKPAKKRKMTKRRRTNPGLTGGTGDVNPQFYSGETIQTANDATSSVTYVFPVPRYSATGNKSIVVEVLKIFYELDDRLPVIAAVTEHPQSLTCHFSTTNFGTTASSFANPKVFSGISIESMGAFTNAGTYRVVMHEPFVQDLTDGVGHGVLLATDSFAVQVMSHQTNKINKFKWKLLYRFKAVSLAEYIGMVQSQQ